MAYDDLNSIGNLAFQQSGNALTYGNIAADLADPFKNDRTFYQGELKNLITNPGDFASSPYYQFAYNEGLNALQRQGGVRSGAKLAALMKYGQDRASQLYGQQAGILAPLATSGSSPAAAGAVYAGATNRAQDYQTRMAAAKYAAANQNRQQYPSYDAYSGYGNALSTKSSMPTASVGADPYAALNDYYRQTNSIVNDILGGKYDSYLSGSSSGYLPSGGSYDPYNDPYWYGSGDTMGGDWGDWGDYYSDYGDYGDYGDF